MTEVDYCICLGRKDPSEPVPRIRVVNVRRIYVRQFAASWRARFSPQFSDLPHQAWDDLDPLAYWEMSSFDPQILESK
jgi:hypothetical protein